MRTITFYSYKGGVGRSLALANIATRLAEFKKQVCLLDFDLEAPGLHYKFATQLANNTKKINKGIVDYIYEFTSEGTVPDSLREYSYSWFPFSQSCVTLIPAGNPDLGTYWKKLSTINWYHLLYENENGLALLFDLKEKIRREINPDFLLVDSRTGISELSGIALSLFADDAVVLAANNRENLDGAKKILRSISKPEEMLLRKAPTVTFVLCRVPFTGSKEDKVKEENLKLKVRRDLGALVQNFSIIHSDRELEENEQIKIGYDKDESVAQVARDYLELFELLTIHDLKPDERENFRKVKESEKYFQKATVEIDPEQKLALLQKAIELNPNKEFYLAQAALFERHGNWAKVVETCEKISQFETIDIRPAETKAHALMRLNRLEEAKGLYETVLFRDPKRISAKLELARIGILEGEYNRSLEMLNEIVGQDPLNAMAYVQRAEAKRAMASSIFDLADALQDVYSALEIQIENPLAVLLKAKINADLGNNDEFYFNLNQALQSIDKLDRDMATEILSDRGI